MQRNNEYFLTLDIETSTIYEDRLVDGEIRQYPKVVWLSYGVALFCDKKGNIIEKCRFRDWITLMNFFDKYSAKFYYYNTLCFVHNLGYEFDYIIKNISKPQKFLSNSTHAVISATLERYKNIEFRCTYQLSGYSLKKLGKLVGLDKLDSEYRTIYPNDEITEEEWIYCERDNEVVVEYICKILLKEFGTLHNIPYTKTGRVRKKLKEFYSQTEFNVEWDLMPTEECYKAMLKAFNGGITISNPLFTNKKVKNVHSYDISSSYPFAEISELFPQKMRRAYPPKRLDYNNYFIAKVALKKITSKYCWQWLSISKMENISHDCNFFNGKLMYGSYVERYMTNVDFEILTWTYDFEYEVLEYYELTDVKEIPECFKKLILHFSEKKYSLKQQLKNCEEYSDEYVDLSRDYMLAKADFNSIYGMMVEKLVKPNYTIDEDFIWTCTDGEYQYNMFKHLKRNFLFGVYITAYARRNLIRAIIKNCPNTFVYADTDSIKFIGENKFVDTNKTVFDEFMQYESTKNLGRFEYEGTYKEFKTLGAKKYCYKDDERIILVVAGLPKSDQYEIHDVDDFKCGVEFKNCKLGKMYINNEKRFELDEDLNVINVSYDEDVEQLKEEHMIDTNGGVGLFPTSYVLDMTETDKNVVIDFDRSYIELCTKLNIPKEII